MGNTSRDLLQFEHKQSSSSSSPLDLLSASQSFKADSAQKPNFTPLPKSQVLGKVKDFLGLMEEANKRLELDAKKNSQAYDIEVLSGNDSEVIEMDLMLGVADLHTPEALAAAELAAAGNQLPIMVAGSSDNGSESHDSSDESDHEESDYKETSNTSKVDQAVTEAEEKRSRSKKRSRIVELS